MTTSDLIAQPFSLSGRRQPRPEMTTEHTNLSDTELAVYRSRSMTFDASRWKKLGLVFLALLFLWVCIEAISGEYLDHRRGKISVLVGFLMAPLAAITALGFTYKLFFRSDFLLLSPEGFRDTRLSKTFIPWTAVEEVHLAPKTLRHDMPFIAVRLEQSFAATLSTNRFQRWQQSKFSEHGMGQLGIMAHTIQTSQSDLRHYFKSYVLANRPEIKMHF